MCVVENADWKSSPGCSSAEEEMRIV